MGSYVKYLGPRGVGCQYLHHLLQGGSLGGCLICLVEMGSDPQYRPNLGGFPPQGGPPSGGNATVTQFIGGGGSIHCC